MSGISADPAAFPAVALKMRSQELPVSKAQSTPGNRLLLFLLSNIGLLPFVFLYNRLILFH